MPGLSAAWAAAASLAAPALRVMLRMRLRRGKELPGRLAERRGVDTSARPPGRLLWLHAASVGETTSILPVLPDLLGRASDLNVLLTTGTVTAADLLARRLEPGLACRVLHRFVPLDVPAWISRFLDHWRPDAAGLVESELWPNLLAACRRRRIPLMLINARISDRSLARWRMVPGLARHVLGGFARVQARSETDARRLRELGCGAVLVSGDLKLAAPPLPCDAAELERLRTRFAGRPIWLAASTHPGEEAMIAQVHAALLPRHPGLLTIIAPRHPERGAAIAADIGGVRRSLGKQPDEGIWIADTLGELGLWYRLCPIVFVGRSLFAPGGGQNPLEPARLGCAIAVGPHTDNFADHVAMLRDEGALTLVADAAALTRWVDALLADPARREAMGNAALAAMCHGTDVPRQTADALLDLLAARR